MSKSPAFQFYPKDWFGSENIKIMSPSERGAYIDLLGQAWLNDDCSIPDDDNKLAVLSGLGDQWHTGSGEKIRECFEKRGKRLVNLRLLEEQEKQEQWRNKCSEGGKKSGESRRNRDLEPKGTSINPQRVDEVKGNSSSSVCSLQSSSASSSTSSKNTEKNIHVFEEIVFHLNETLGSKYKHTSQATQRLIKARLDEGHTLEDFKQVHITKHVEWNNTDMAKFLRPSTLYGTKFESYLNQLVNKPLTLAEKNAKTIKEAFDDNLCT